MGRPRTPVTIEDIDGAMVALSMDGGTPAQSDLEAELDVSRTTIRHRILEDTGLAWAAYRDRFRVSSVSSTGRVAMPDPDAMTAIKVLVPADVADALHLEASRRRTSVASVAGGLLTRHVRQGAAPSTRVA